MCASDPPSPNICTVYIFTIACLLYASQHMCTHMHSKIDLDVLQLLYNAGMHGHQYTDSSTIVTVNNSCRKNISSKTSTHSHFFSTSLLLPSFSHWLSFVIQTEASYTQVHMHFFKCLICCRASWCSITKCLSYITSLYADTTQIHLNTRHMETDNNGPTKTFQHTDTHYIKCAHSYFRSLSFSPWFDPFQLSNTTQ